MDKNSKTNSTNPFDLSVKSAKHVRNLRHNRGPVG